MIINHRNTIFLLAYKMKDSPLWTWKETAVALVIIIIWGINFAPMKLGLEKLSPLELGFFRYFFATFPMIFFVRLPPIRIRLIFSLAFIQVCQFYLLFYGMNIGVPASLASVLMQTQVFFTVLWSLVIFKQRPTKVVLISVLLAFIGLVLFGINSLSGSDIRSLSFFGLIVVLSAASMWGIVNIITKQIQNESPNYSVLSLVAWSGLITTIIYLFLIFLFDDNAGRWLMADSWENIGVKVWVSVIFLGFGASIIGAGLWAMLLKRHQANKVAPFSLGIPVVGLSVGVLLLDETINIWQWLGTSFVVLSLAVVIFGEKWISYNKGRAS